ncbi:lysylphosphatidylglycerol synthase domain-containing protein [Aeromicrobium duanguangcaii]|uniref:lysylphosphatidylglycerol synthase domain-containing protein n=1 Tax=Aeromicrobium duanguangcaii TaxID=2968086 RepID=UPI0020170F1C|nr:flippase-like domain-containing protein [Aeromicrobium duanguangcaii]
MNDEIPAVVPASTSSVGRWLKIVVAVVAVGLLALALWRQRDGVAVAVERLSALDLVVAGIFGAAGVMTAGLSWRLSLSSVAGGRPLPLSVSARVYFVSQLGKYIPGSLWPVVIQAEMTRRYGLGRAQNAAGMLIAILIGLVTNACVAAVAVVLVDRQLLESYWYVLLVIPAAIVLLMPRVLVGVVTFGARMLRRRVEVPSPQPAALFAAAAWCLLSWVLFGLHAWVLASAIGGAGVALGIAIGGYALAWMVGFLAILAPAGVGAREGVLVLAFSSVLTSSEALLLAVVSRLLLTVVDALAGLVGVLIGWRSSATSGSPPPSRD